jgi:hypothetical protein
MAKNLKTSNQTRKWPLLVPTLTMVSRRWFQTTAPRSQRRTKRRREGLEKDSSLMMMRKTTTRGVAKRLRRADGARSAGGGTEVGHGFSLYVPATDSLSTALEEDLEEDDLDLLEENTGTRIARKNKLTRLRRGRESESPVESRAKKPYRSILDDQLSEDEDDLGVEPQVADDVRGIWDDDRVGGRDLEDDVDMDDDFIDDDLDDDGMGDLGEEEREERRKERLRLERERRKALGRPDMVGIDARCLDFASSKTFLLNPCLKCLG